MVLSPITRSVPVITFGVEWIKIISHTIIVLFYHFYLFLGRFCPSHLQVGAPVLVYYFFFLNVPYNLEIFKVFKGETIPLILPFHGPFFFHIQIKRNNITHQKTPALERKLITFYSPLSSLIYCYCYFSKHFKMRMKNKIKCAYLKWAMVI